MAKSKSIILKSPLKGMWDGSARSEQPEDTTVDALNVVPFDRTYRARLSTRSGTSALATVGSGTIRGMLQTSLGSGAGKTVYLVVVSGNTLYTTSDLANFTNRGTLSSSTGPIQVAAGRGFVVLIDGSTPTVLNLNTMTLATLASMDTAGTSPTSVSLCAIWRDRLVLAGPDHQWFMSRVGTFTDWNYGQDDVGTAMSGQNAASTVPGAISDPIVALIPASDDVLLFGQDQRFYQMLGDPGAGGVINLVSDTVGIAGPNAWGKDASQTVWIVGTGGLFKFDGVSMQPATDRNLVGTFAAINRANDHVSIAWDREGQALWIFLTHLDLSATTHVLFDKRFGGMWKQRMPTNHGPIGSTVYDGDDPDDRYVLLGGSNGVVRYLDPTAKSDAGTAISSYCWLGPVQPFGPDADAFVSDANFVLGEDDGGAVDFVCDWTFQGGTDPYSAYASAAESRTGQFTTAGRQDADVRIAANTFFLKLANTTNNVWWNFERLSLTAVEAGANR